MTFSLYELAKQPDLQEKLRQEIYETLQLNQGRVTYDILSLPSKLPFLHQVLCETMRLYTGLSVIDRQCMKIDGYSLEPYSHFKIPLGMPIWVPIHAIAKDEKYFPQPLTFDPNRFNNADNLPRCSFLFPFGAGPKQCIGQRLALIQVKTAIVSVLKEFRIEMNAHTPREFKLKKDAFLIESDERLVVDFIKDPLKFT